MTDAGMESAATKPGLADLAEIFYAPSAVFARRQDGKFGMAYLGLVVLGLVIFFATKGLVQPVIDAVISSSIDKQVAAGKIPADQAGSAMSIARTAGMVIPLAFYIVGPFVVGLVLWLAGKLSSVRSIGTVAIMVATFSMFPRLLGSVGGALIAAMTPDGSLTNPTQLSIGPAHLMAPNASPVLAALASRFDIFIIWGVILMATGVRVAGKATKGQAWTAALITWGVFTALALLGGARQG